MEETSRQLTDLLAPIDKAIDSARDAIAFCVDSDELGDLVCEATRLQNRLAAFVGEVAHAAYGSGCHHRDRPAHGRAIRRLTHEH